MRSRAPNGSGYASSRRRSVRTQRSGLHCCKVPARPLSARAPTSIPIPTIAVIRGACTGGGCGLALACDLRLASPDAFFAIPPARLGIAYSLADTKRLQDLVGPARTKEILYTGRRIGAEEALAIGLINHIVAADGLAARAEDLAHEISGNARNSVRAAKRVSDLIAAGTLAETPESRGLYDASFESPEFAEGTRAFIEKRPPKF